MKKTCDDCCAPYDKNKCTDPLKYGSDIPIGMFHCKYCGVMQLAGTAHSACPTCHGKHQLGKKKKPSKLAVAKCIEKAMPNFKYRERARGDEVYSGVCANPTLFETDVISRNSVPHLNEIYNEPLIDVDEEYVFTIGGFNENGSFVYTIFKNNERRSERLANLCRQNTIIKFN